MITLLHEIYMNLSLQYVNEYSEFLHKFMNNVLCCVKHFSCYALACACFLFHLSVGRVRFCESRDVLCGYPVAEVWGSPRLWSGFTLFLAVCSLLSFPWGSVI